jgi:hypothetical protein
VALRSTCAAIIEIIESSSPLCAPATSHSTAYMHLLPLFSCHITRSSSSRLHQKAREARGQCASIGSTCQARNNTPGSCARTLVQDLAASFPRASSSSLKRWPRYSLNSWSKEAATEVAGEPSRSRTCHSSSCVPSRGSTHGPCDLPPKCLAGLQCSHRPQPLITDNDQCVLVLKPLLSQDCRACNLIRWLFATHTCMQEVRRRQMTQGSKLVGDDNTRKLMFPSEKNNQLSQSKRGGRYHGEERLLLEVACRAACSNCPATALAA